MIHKNLLLLFLGLILSAASCRQESPGEETAVVETGRVCFRLDEGKRPTKLGGIVYERDEEPLSQWTFFLFESSTGKLVYRETVNNASWVERTLRTGSYELYVIGNYPTAGSYRVDVSSIRTKDQFLALKAGLADNTTGAFVMAGSSQITVEASTGNEELQEIAIRMQRLVAKLTLENVTRAFTSPSLASQPLTIKHIYLTNVYTEAPYGSDLPASALNGDPGLWYNAMGWHGVGGPTPSAAADLLTGERNLNIGLPQGESRSIGRSLYFFPNPLDPSADSHGDTWTGPRCTRLVLETEVGGSTYYYQATLNTSLVRNTAFAVSCTLTQLGSTDPEQMIPGQMELRFRFVPDDDWGERISVNEDS